VLQQESSKSLNLLRSTSSRTELPDFSAHPSIEVTEVYHLQILILLIPLPIFQFPEKHRLWYKEAVFYEVYTRAFCDTTGR
jgi:hypothetical protein